MENERVITGVASGRNFLLGKSLIRGSCGMIYPGMEGGKAVAIKVPYPVDDPIHTQVITKEARLQAAVRHPNITPVVLFDTSTDFEPGMHVPFLVTPLARMDLLTLTSQGPLPIQDALEVSLQIGSAVAHANAQGILHRDIRATNVLIADDTPGHLRVALSDFGNAAYINDPTACPPPTHVQRFPPEVFFGRYREQSEQWDWAEQVVYSAAVGSDPKMRPYIVSRSVPRHRYVFPFRQTIESLVAPTAMTPFHAVLDEVAGRALAEDSTARYPNMGELVFDLQKKSVKAAEQQAKEKKILIL